MREAIVKFSSFLLFALCYKDTTTGATNAQYQTINLIRKATVQMRDTYIQM